MKYVINIEDTKENAQYESLPLEMERDLAYIVQQFKILLSENPQDPFVMEVEEGTLIIPGQKLARDCVILINLLE